MHSACTFYSFTYSQPNNDRFPCGFHNPSIALMKIITAFSMQELLGPILQLLAEQWGKGWDSSFFILCFWGGGGVVEGGGRNRDGSILVSNG